MALFSSQSKRLELPTELGFAPGDWVEIKTRYTAGMRQRVMSRAMQFRIRGDLGAAASISLDDFDIDIWSFRTALLDEIVVGWSDDAPVTPESLGEIDAPVQDWIADQFDELVKARTSEATAFLGASSLSGSPPMAAATSPASSGT